MPQVDLDAAKKEARRRVHNLVEDYMRVLAAGKKESFNEERVKIAYVVPFLEALSWNPRTDEVLPEQATLTGRADFGLRVGGRTKIFVEMKSFNKSLDGYDIVKGRHRSYAEQAIQYAWGMKADWAVLTNFEEIRLYDSRVKKPGDGLVWKIRFTEYESRFDELWLICKESVASGALDAYRAKVERPPVDEAFLVDLMNCRQLLAEDIKKNNPVLTSDLIDESVQKILDRLIFIKNCEDRLIIPAESLWKRFKAWQETAIDKDIVIFMMDLKNLFRYFDQVYNGKLFEKHPCEDSKISNEVLEEIINTLYGDGLHLGYNFSVIPVDVLGQAYELYIGSIIKEKEGQAKAIEIVKEASKRKTHGIYYTPEYVVDYIVRNTLGVLLKDCKTPEDVSRIKILDPACGSGSFLIKAFDVIKEWYDNYNKKNRPVVPRNSLEAHIVPIPNVEERILTENLYGVDLDPQAVEITILNLSLKGVRTKDKLPYIGDHIRCGNSLLSERELSKAKKPFSWKKEFPDVFKEEGFSVIVGNPPYVRKERIPKEEKGMLKIEFPEIYHGDNDLYVYFVGRGTELLRPGGMFGYIVSSKFTKARYGKKLREYISKNCRIEEFLNLSGVRVFEEVANDPCILILRKEPLEQNRKSNLVKVGKIEKKLESPEALMEHIRQHINKSSHSDDVVTIFQMKQSSLSGETWKMVPLGTRNVFEKIEANSDLMLKDICDVFFGIKPGFIEALVVNEKRITELNLERKILKPVLRGEDVRRFSIDFKQKYLVFPYTGEDYECIDINEYHNLFKFLNRYKENLANRYDIKKSRSRWYELRPCSYYHIFESPKIISPDISERNNFAYDDSGYYCLNTCYVISLKESYKRKYDKRYPQFLKYITALLNSSTLEFYFKQIAAYLGEKGYRYFKGYLDKLPIRELDVNSAEDGSKFNDLVSLVEKLHFLTQKFHRINLDFEKYVTEPIMGHSSFRKFWDELSVNEKQAIDRISKGKIRTYKVEENGNWLVFKVDYLTSENGRRRSYFDVEVLKCRFDDEKLRKFLFYTIKNYDKLLGTGNLMYKILAIKIPFFSKKPDENNRTIDKIMGEYLKAIEDKKQLEKRIQVTDDLINDKVYDLYGLSQEDISRVQSSI